MLRRERNMAKTDVQLADEGIYLMASLDALREECSELETIKFNESDWDGPGYYEFKYEEGQASFLGARCSACGFFAVDPEGCEECSDDL